MKNIKFVLTKSKLYHEQKGDRFKNVNLTNQMTLHAHNRIIKLLLFLM